MSSPRETPARDTRPVVVSPHLNEDRRTSWTLQLGTTTAITGSRQDLTAAVQRARAALDEYARAEHDNGCHHVQPEPRSCSLCRDDRTLTVDLTATAVRATVEAAGCRDCHDDAAQHDCDLQRVRRLTEEQLDRAAAEVLTHPPKTLDEMLTDLTDTVLNWAENHATPARQSTPDLWPLDRLFAVANDGEAGLLDDLMRRAGVIWTCPGCAWHNPADSRTCEQCGTRTEPAAPGHDSAMTRQFP